MLRTLAGLCYGGVLGLLSIVAAGAGHGTYIPMAVSSAPFGFFGFRAAAVAAPILWGAVGVLLHRHRMGSRKRIIPIVLLIHYGSAVALAVSPSFGDWAYVQRSMPAIGTIMFTWGAIYVLGQLAIWRAVLRAAR
jgi:energy-converting hydrogenase Eha subunit C